MIPLGDGKEHKQKKGKQKETTNLSKKKSLKQRMETAKIEATCSGKKNPQNQVARAN